MHWAKARGQPTTLPVPTKRELAIDDGIQPSGDSGAWDRVMRPVPATPRKMDVDARTFRRPPSAGRPMLRCRASWPLALRQCRSRLFTCAWKSLCLVSWPPDHPAQRTSRSILRQRCLGRWIVRTRPRSPGNPTTMYSTSWIRRAVEPLERDRPDRSEPTDMRPSGYWWVSRWNFQ